MALGPNQRLGQIWFVHELPSSKAKSNSAIKIQALSCSALPEPASHWIHSYQTLLWLGEFALTLAVMDASSKFSFSETYFNCFSWIFSPNLQIFRWFQNFLEDIRSLHLVLFSELMNFWFFIFFHLHGLMFSKASVLSLCICKWHFKLGTSCLSDD